jgi:hypothetical protein
VEVEQHRGRTRRGEEQQGFLAVDRRLHGIPRARQGVTEEAAYVWIVVDDQDVNGCPLAG